MDDLVHNALSRLGDNIAIIQVAVTIEEADRATDFLKQHFAYIETFLKLAEHIAPQVSTPTAPVAPHMYTDPMTPAFSTNSPVAPLPLFPSNFSAPSSMQTPLFSAYPKPMQQLHRPAFLFSAKPTPSEFVPLFPSNPTPTPFASTKPSIYGSLAPLKSLAPLEPLAPIFTSSLAPKRKHSFASKVPRTFKAFKASNASKRRKTSLRSAIRKAARSGTRNDRFTQLKLRNVMVLTSQLE